MTDIDTAYGVLLDAYKRLRVPLPPVSLFRATFEILGPLGMMRVLLAAVDGATVGAVLADLERAHPGFRERLFDDAGKLRRFVNVFVADEDIRFLQGLETPVAEGQVVSIVPAVAGG